MANTVAFPQIITSNKTFMNYQIFARKWRPQTFDDVIGHKVVVKSLQHALETNKLHHAYLLTGTRGVGKTSIARLIAKSINCENPVTSNPCNECNSCISISSGNFTDVIEIDAASRTKVEDMRDLLDNVQYMPKMAKYKIYIIDEVHMLSNHSFNALLKTLEEPPAHVKFILATTNPEKLPITILSRCLRLHLKSLSESELESYLVKVLDSESLTYTNDSLKIIVQYAKGSARDALSLLEQAIAYGKGELLYENVVEILGTIDKSILYSLLKAIHNKDKLKISEILNSIENIDYKNLLENLLDITYRLAMTISIPNIVSEADEELIELSTIIPATTVQLFYQFILTGIKELAYADGKQTFNISILRMLEFLPVHQNDLDKMEVEKVVEVKETTPAEVKQPEPVEPVISKDIQETMNKVKESFTQHVQSQNTPKTLPKKEEQPIQKKIAPAGEFNWSEILKNINFSGLVKALLSNCTLNKFENNFISLTLDNQFQAMLSIPYKQEAEKLLSQYFNKAIKVEIELGQQDIETPVEQNKREYTEKANKAKHDIQNDENIKRIIETYNAEIKEISLLGE